MHPATNNAPFCSQKSSMKTATKIRTFIADESGPTAVEYAVMLGLIIAVCLVAVLLFGTSLSTSVDDSQIRMEQAGLGS